MSADGSQASSIKNNEVTLHELADTDTFVAP